jgi:hypothetical protein
MNDASIPIGTISAEGTSYRRDKKPKALDQQMELKLSWLTGTVSVYSSTLLNIFCIVEQQI